MAVFLCIPHILDIILSHLDVISIKALCMLDKQILNLLLSRKWTTGYLQSTIRVAEYFAWIIPHILSYDCKTLVGHKYITHVEFGTILDQPINALGQCQNLTHVDFGASFNQPVDTLGQCQNLTHIKFERSFKRYA